MPSVLNPIVDLYQTQLEASRRLADVVFSGTEKIDRVVIEATHHAFTEQLNFAQAVASARDPKGMASLQANFLSRRPDSSAVNYQKEIMRVFAEIQNEIGRSMQSYIEQLGVNIANNATAPLKAVQDQASDTVFNPMTGMFSVWESAFREVASMANKNMAAARSNFENVTDALAGAATDVTRQTAGAVAEAAKTTTDATSETAGAVTSVTINGGSSAPADSSNPSVDGGEVVEERKPHPGSSKRK